MGNKTHIDLNADSVNAIAKALGAVVMATVQRLPAAEREAFARDLAAMSMAAADSGDTTLETLLLDLHRAARNSAQIQM